MLCYYIFTRILFAFFAVTVRQCHTKIKGYLLTYLLTSTSTTFIGAMFFSGWNGLLCSVPAFPFPLLLPFLLPCPAKRPLKSPKGTGNDEICLTEVRSRAQPWNVFRLKGHWVWRNMLKLPMGLLSPHLWMQLHLAYQHPNYDVHGGPKISCCLAVT